jgi:hypothetical protein
LQGRFDLRRILRLGAGAGPAINRFLEALAVAAIICDRARALDFGPVCRRRLDGAVTRPLHLEPGDEFSTTIDRQNGGGGARFLNERVFLLRAQRSRRVASGLGHMGTRCAADTCFAAVCLGEGWSDTGGHRRDARDSADSKNHPSTRHAVRGNLLRESIKPVFHRSRPSGSRPPIYCLVQVRR